MTNVLPERAACLFVLCAALTAPAAVAQGVAHASVSAFPAKPVRMIVPLAPGGGSDIIARVVALALTDYWQQSVIVDNRPGAGSTVGTGIAARSPADGYTWLVSSSSIAISPALYKSLPFDVRRDFAGVTLLASQPSILAVHASVPATSVKELVALAKAQPGKLTYGSAGVGSATHLGAELFKYQAGVDLLHVPYKSAGQATAALLAGEVQVLITNMASVLPQLKGGKIRALGVSSKERSPLAKDLPTIAEAGVPGFEYATWYGMLMPAGTSKAIVARVQSDTANVLKSPRVHDRLTAQGLEVYASTPVQFETYLREEIAKWDKVVKAAGIQTE